jgi:glyoxylase-like metal-dependent hydrolase (beta-lactamase superfamily II)
MKRFAILLLLPLCAFAEGNSTRIYIFDDGKISGLDPTLFNFEADELAETDFVIISYLVVHPNGTLMFDSGGIPDAAFDGHAGPVVDGVMSASQRLVPQLEAAGYSPDDIDYFALSHYHSDHTGNANLFAGSTWIVQQADYDWMFADEPEGIIAADTFSELEKADKIVLADEDFDVFGDGSVMILSAPGHTPGHQVLAVKLDNAGWVVLGGDLYHYPEERTTGRTPSFEFDPAQSRLSRARIEDFLEDHDAALWIEHDMATHARLPKAPAYVD